MSESIVTTTVEIKPATSSIRQPATQQRVRSTFYVGMAGALLLIVLLGFTPTFYLRAFFNVPEIPGPVFVHGIVLTAWFVGFFLQTALVAAHRTDLHRRVGGVLAGLGVVVLVTSTAVTLNFVPRQRAVGANVEAALAVFSEIVWLDFANLLAFALFVAIALTLRHRPEVHKRLMLLASISLVQPALGRIFRWPVFGGLNPTLLGLGVLLLLLLALGLYDRSSRKQVHPVTLFGGLFFMGAKLISIFVIATSEVGRSFVRGLG